MTSGRFAVLLLASVAAYCHDDPAPSCPLCPPAVYSIQIVPGRIEVQAGSVFEIEARLIDAGGRDIPAFFGYQPVWAITPAVLGAPVGMVLHRDGHAVTIEMLGVALGTSFTITAAVHDVSDDANGIVVGPPSSPTDYVERDGHTGSAGGPIRGAPLAIVLATDGPIPDWDAAPPVAFAGIGHVGALGTPGGGIMLLSSDKELAFDVAGWQANSQDVARYRSGANAMIRRDLRSPLPVDVHVWIDPNAGPDVWTAVTAEAVVTVHVADATAVYGANRAGVRFDVKSAWQLPTDHGIPTTCLGAWPTTAFTGTALDGSGTTRTFGPAANEINIFVIALEGETAGWCTGVGGGTDHRILINAANPIPTGVAHELGHALMGGSDEVAMGERNVMWNETLDNTAAPRRSHLSLGQVCLLNQSPILTGIRGAPGPSACPVLTKDIP